MEDCDADDGINDVTDDVEWGRYSCFGNEDSLFFLGNSTTAGKLW